MKRFGALALVAVLFVVANACSSDEADAIRRGKLADGCLINSDCSQSPLPLVCAFERCHIKCEKDADCEPGLYCRIADNPVHVCQLPSEVPDPPCKYSSECPGSQVCGIDGVCRDGCKTSKDCVPEQVCVSATCASKNELDKDGQLPNKSGEDGGTSACLHNSDCPGDEVCLPVGKCGVECKGAKDCATSESCVANQCVPKGGGPTTLPEHCKNGTKDGDESGSDCGGSCYPCPSGGDCGKAQDCASQVCTAAKCQEPICSDGVRNGSETGTDCGGPNCAACPPAETCTAPGDCSTGICKSGTCVDPTCADGQQNGKETDVDCGGGACPACDGANKGCVIGGDCTSGICTAYSCALASCTDGVKNGKETGQDCGGATCKACSVGKGCSAPSDCVSNVCTGGSCVAASCGDGVKNGTETDVDCGGADCGKCASGKACAQPNDCSAGSCVGNVCKGSFKLTVTPAGTGAGTVKSDVGGIDCGAKCSADILDGSSVVLTATPAGTSNFSGWSGGGCSGTATCSLTLSADTTVTATFGGVAPGGVVWKKSLNPAAGIRLVPGGTDAAGNQFFAGAFNGLEDFGGGPVTSTAIDAYVAKYSPGGAWLWSRKLGGAGNQVPEQLFVEPGGDVVVIGTSTAATGLDFGGAPLTCAADGLFLARFAGSDGAYKWSKCIGDGVDSVRSSLLDGNNFVIAGTLLAGTTDFGTGVLTAQARDMFIASFTLTNGATVAAKDFGGAQDDYGMGLARASDGSFALIGTCDGSVDFGGGAVTVAKGNEDICIARLTSSWTGTWARQLGDVGVDNGYALAFAPSGKLLMTGTFRGQVDFDTGVVDIAKGNGDIVLAQLNPTTGAIEWHKVFGTTNGEYASHLVVAANGDIVLAGKASEAFSFGGPTVTGTNCVKLTSTGGHIWSFRDGSEWGNPTGLVLTSGGGVVLGVSAGAFGSQGYVLAP